MFTKEFWRSSAKKLKSTKFLALMGIFIAARIAMASLYIPVGENLHVSITYLLVALEAMIVGPVAGMVSGAVADIVGFLMFPDGAFFAGYTLTAMAGSLAYAVCLYHAKPTLLRIIIAKFLTSFPINVGMGALWSAMLYSKGYYYYFMKSLTKNALLFPIQIALLFLFLKAITPWLEKKRIIETRN